MAGQFPNIITKPFLEITLMASNGELILFSSKQNLIQLDCNGINKMATALWVLRKQMCVPAAVNFHKKMSLSYCSQLSLTFNKNENQEEVYLLTFTKESDELVTEVLKIDSKVKVIQLAYALYQISPIVHGLDYPTSFVLRTLIETQSQVFATFDPQACATIDQFMEYLKKLPLKSLLEQKTLFKSLTSEETIISTILFNISQNQIFIEDLAKLGFIANKIEKLGIGVFCK